MTGHGDGVASDLAGIPVTIGSATSRPASGSFRVLFAHTAGLSVWPSPGLLRIDVGAYAAQTSSDGPGVPVERCMCRAASH